jgi:hypothetical protein
MPATQACSCYAGTGAAKTKTVGSKGTRRKPKVHRQTFPSFFQLTQIRRRMLRPIVANVSCSSLSASVTCEHTNTALSSTCLQLIGGSRKLGEPGSKNPGTLVMRTSILWLQSFLPLRYLALSHNHEHNN